MKTFTFDLQLFAVLSNSYNASVSQGSTGAITTDGSAGNYPYPDHAYTNPNNDLLPELKTFYDEQLIALATPQLVHEQFCVKKPIPKGQGKTIEFRKFDPLPLATTPILEGVTPDGTPVRVTAIHATIEQYGAWIGTTDIISLVSIDNVVNQNSKLLANQMAKTRDTLIRDVMQAGTNVMYCPKTVDGALTEVTSRDDLDSTAGLTVAAVQRAVAILRGQDAPTMFGEDYGAIIHPYAAYNLMRDPAWEQIQNYATPENRLRGEIGRIAGVRFVQSTNAKVLAPAQIAGTIYQKVTVATAVTSLTTSVTIEENLGTHTGLNIPVWINGVENTITATSGTTITLGTGIATLAVGDEIVAKGGTKDGSPIYCTLIVADEAVAVTDLEGGGAEVIVKPLGSGEDRLNQRASTGWKMSFVAERLVEQYLLRVESASAEIPALAN